MEHAKHSMAQNHRMMIADFKKRFFISCLLSLPVIFLSPMIQMVLGTSLSFPGDQWVIFILSTMIFIYGGKPFLIGMYQELHQLRPAMMTLIGLAIIISYAYSAAVIFGLPGTMLFAELVTLIDIMLLGHWIEMKSVLGASLAVEKLATLLPAIAHRKLPDGTIQDVPLSELKKGDYVVIKPGEKISADGKVVQGESDVNEAALTGESTLVFKSPSSKVIAGSLNQNGSIVVQVDKDLHDAYISQIINMVHAVLESKSKAQDIADKAAFGLTIIALTIGSLTFFVWLFLSGNLAFALERLVGVMVISCPHALGLAIPLVIAVVTALAAKQGLLIRDRRAFDEARNLDMVVFDKTGTLTHGMFEVTDIVPLGNVTEKELLGIAAGIETYSEHSISKAIVKKAHQSETALETVEKFHTIAGKGSHAMWHNNTIYIGNTRLVEEAGLSKSDIEMHMNLLNTLNNQGKTAIFIVIAKKIEGIIALADTIREESFAACNQLKAMGIQIAMITGDNKLNALIVAKKLGIETVLAEILPEQKANEIQKLQDKGITVAMVGDGINDAPALARANVGIAIGAGTDVALETADIILIQNDPQKVVAAINLSRITRKKMIQNLLWATGYNVIAIPLAAGVFYSFGLTITPAIGAFIMSISTVIVAINSRFISL